MVSEECRDGQEDSDDGTCRDMYLIKEIQEINMKENQKMEERKRSRSGTPCENLNAC